MAIYGVLMPIGGHAYVEVSAANEQEAIEAAIGMVEFTHIEEWDVLHKVNTGNVCHFPTPWAIEADVIEETE